MDEEYGSSKGIKDIPFLMCKDITTDFFLLTLNKLDVGEHAISLVPSSEFR